MNVVVDGLMTNYQKLGKGKVVVLLHGWGDSAKSFSKIIEDLQDSYTVLALDLPGFGGTQTPEHAWGLEDYAGFVANWLKKIDIEQVHALIAHSYGGSMAIAGLGNGILKADKLVLLASSGVRSGKRLRKKLLKAGAKAAKGPLYLLPPSRRQKLRRKFYESVGSDLTLLPHMELTFKRIIGEDVQSAATQIKIPALLLYGTRDNDTPLKDGRILHRALSNSELKVIDGAGHFLHQEQPAKITEAIRLFLDGGKT